MLGGFGRGFCLAVDSILDFVAVALQPAAYIGWHVFRNELARERITQNGLHAIIGSHHHEAWLGGEDVKVGESSRLREVGQLGGFRTVVVQEGRRHFAGCFRCYALGYHGHGGKQQQYQGCRKSFHYGNPLLNLGRKSRKKSVCCAIFLPNYKKKNVSSQQDMSHPTFQAAFPLAIHVVKV